MPDREALDAAILAYRENPSEENKQRLMILQGARAAEFRGREAREWQAKVRWYDQNR